MIYSSDFPCRSVGPDMRVDPVACHFPGLKRVGIHGGVPWVDEMIAMVWKHKNVYVGRDTHSPEYWPDSFVRFFPLSRTS